MKPSRNRCFLSAVLALVAAGPVIAQQEVPVPGPRQVVTGGPHVGHGNPPVVNEPNLIMHIAYDPVEDRDVLFLICMWQVGEIPTGNLTEDPVRLEYSVGSIYRDPGGNHVPENGDITWGQPMVVLMPEGALDARDPAMTVFDDDFPAIGQLGDRIAAAGVFTNDSADFESIPYVARTIEDSTFFTIIDSLIGVEAAYLRFAQLSPQQGGGASLNDDLYLFGRALEDNLTGIVRGQLVMRYSNLGGDGWAPWVGIVDVNNGNTPIFGVPGQPVGFAAGRGLVSYMDDQAMTIGTLTGEWEVSDSRIVFTESALEIEANMELGSEPTYFAASKNYLAGDFEIGPFTDLAIGMGAGGVWHAYLAYHDLAGEPSGGDGDFNVYLMRGEWDPINEEWIWPTAQEGWPKKVNLDNAGVRSDQFMPAVCVDGDDRVHLVWYDTRHDLKSPGQDVRIGLYYAYSEDFGQTFSEIMLDDDLIRTEYLSNPNSLGDRIDIVARTSLDLRKGVVATYMGTQHPLIYEIEPQGLIFNPGPPVQPQSDELIYSKRIDWIEQ